MSIVSKVQTESNDSTSRKGNRPNVIMNIVSKKKQTKHNHERNKYSREANYSTSEKRNGAYVIMNTHSPIVSKKGTKQT